MLVLFTSTRIPLLGWIEDFNFPLVDWIVDSGLQVLVERVGGSKFQPPRSLWELGGRSSQRLPLLCWRPDAEWLSPLVIVCILEAM